MRQAIADLSAHVGNNPTAAERLIIQSAAIKATRLFLLSEKIMAGGEVGGIDGDHHALAWLNSLRQDLSTLGLESRLRDVTPTLKDIIAEHAAQAGSAA